MAEHVAVLSGDDQLVVDGDHATVLWIEGDLVCHRSSCNKRYGLLWLVSLCYRNPTGN